MSDAKSVTPEFVGNRPRSEVVELDYPIKLGDKTYSLLTVRRLTAQQVADWVAAIKGGDQDASLGNVVDDDGNLVPKQVLEFLDDDDDLKLNEVMERFLPRRLSESLTSDPETPTS